MWKRYQHAVIDVGVSVTADIIKDLGTPTNECRPVWQVHVKVCLIIIDDNNSMLNVL